MIEAGRGGGGRGEAAGEDERPQGMDSLSAQGMTE